MADLILLPTLERLHPYGGAGLTAFGMTLSVALGDPKKLGSLGAWKDLGISFLQPWSWGAPGPQLASDLILEIERVVFFSLPDGAKSKPVPIHHQARNKDFDKALSKRFLEFVKLEPEGQISWSWSPGSTKVGRSSRPWPGLVGQVSLYPYPLPQALRLAFYLELDEDLGPRVVAAPVLRFQIGGTLVELIPKPPQNEDNRTMAYDWPAPTPPAPVPPGNPAAPPTPPAPAPATQSLPTIVAQTMPCDTGNPTKTTYFDFESLWVKTNDVTVTSTDWRAGLELRLAEQLHIPRTVVEWMKNERKSRAAAKKKTLGKNQVDEKKTDPELAASYPKLAWFAIQQLQAVLGPGLRKGPDGSLLQRASEFLKMGPLPPGFQDRAIAWFAKDSDGHQWRGWLREAVSGAPLADGVTGARLLDAAISAAPEEAIARLLSFDQTVSELDQLLASVAAPETVRALFKLQWKAYVESNFKTPGSSTEEKLARALAGDLPKEVDLQRLLLLDHLGEHWDEIQKAFADSPSLDGVRTGIKNSYVKILKKLPAPIWKDPVLESLGATFSDRVLPQELDSLEQSGTRGLTFQLDTLAQDPGKDDLLQHMQGMAVLMRTNGGPDSDWHCLNLAAANVGGTIIDPVLIPSRLAYVNDLRSPTLSYDNAPLTVPGPMGHAEVAGAELRDPNEEHKAIDDPLIELTHSTKGKIPALVFGRSYEIQPFLVTNSGALPKLLTNGNPWELKAKIPNNLKSGATPISRKYLREAHVGALRFLSDEASGLPPIPANVAPQIRELAPESVLPKDDPLLARKTDAGLAGMPLLLLASPGFHTKPGVKLRDAFKFSMLPPTVDLQTWDRWVAMDAATKDRRKFVWRSFHQLSYEQGLKESKLEKAGVYLDDPAVAGIWVELVQIEAGKQTSLGSLSFTLPGKVAQEIKPDFSNWKTARCTLKTEQHDPIPVSFSFDKDGNLKVRVRDQDLLPASPVKPLIGKLFRLSFYAFLKPGAEDLFKQKEYVPREDKKEGTSPWHLLIEIPRSFTRSQQLQTSLRKALSPKFEDGNLKVALDLNDKDLLGLQGAIYRAELLHQVWSWRGRPPAPLPVGASQDDDPKRVAFEMSEFGERSDDEHRRLPMPRTANTKSLEPVFLYQENLVAPGPQGDRRALYHRFSARVFSRWEGILPDEESFLDAQDEMTKVRWRPLFVPCRQTGDVPVPKVKLVLPLTQGESENVTDGPGLLVVTDGAWYEVGGLAEELGVEVMEVTGPVDKRIQYHQAGTDPIMTGQSAGEILGDPEGALRTSAYRIDFELVGAIGHHRDHSQTAPRFLASSFLLARPLICHKESSGKDKILPVDLSWWFLKLRFRRILHLPSGEAVSDWSAPFWVQILPGVERVEEDWFGSGDLEVLMDDKDQVCVKGRTVPAPQEKLHLFGVVTRKVIDFAGRPDQEVYLGVWRPGQGRWVTDVKATDSKTPGSREGLYVRWIEVQSPRLPQIDSGDALWKAIFDPGQADAERARILRISKRFSINAGSCP
jgi:hypothetical protein